VVKYGLAMDEGLFDLLEQKNEDEFTAAELQDIVMRCCRLKAGIIEMDERERTGKRAILNFGHTVGHAIETATRLQGLSHGEAVAIGMAAAARISARTGMLNRSHLPRIESLLAKFGLPVYCRGVNPDELVEATRFDKKTTGGKTGWVLLKEIGKGVTSQPVAEDIVREVLGEICR
jgi:3-dehydroquinate synthetase